MSCHENELQREREYEEFMDAFEVVDKKVKQALLNEVGDSSLPMVCAVLAKHLVLGCKRMGDTEETFLKLMKETSFCGLGKTCNAPMLSAMKHMRNELYL